MSIIRAYTSAVVKAYIRSVIPGYDGEPRISLDTGQFIVTGNDALLQYGFIPLGKGEYLMTGNSMSLLTGRLLALGKGEFDLTGNDMTFEAPTGFDGLAPSDLVLTVINDTSIKLDFTVNSTDRDGHSIERSTDGVNYSVIDTVLADTATYTDATGADGTRYYYRVRAYKDTTYSAYCNAANDWTAIKMVLTAKDTGAGVSTVRFGFVTTDVVATLDGNGKWYSDSGGTADESASYTFTAGSLVTRYLKVTSGSSNMLIFAKGNWEQWGYYNTFGWVSAANAATISKTLSNILTLKNINVTGNNTIVCDITNMTSLITFRCNGPNIGGSINNLVNLTNLFADYQNRITGDLGGSGTSAICNGITLLQMDFCRFTEYTSGATWTLIMSSTINPSVGYGYSSTEIDNMLIDMAASLGTVSEKTITLKGSSAARTSASDAAVSTLNGKGWTVVTNLV